MTDHHDTSPPKQNEFLLRVVIWAVALEGLLTIASSLLEQFSTHHRFHHLAGSLFSMPIVVGLTLLYISSLLARRKRTAWVVAVSVYSFIVLLSAVRLMFFDFDKLFTFWNSLRDVVLPLVVLTGLLAFHRRFRVKSDLDSFRQSMRFIVVIAAVVFVYGVVGYMLMDERDFHTELGFQGAVVHTVDQLSLVSKPLTPYTRRGHIFSDSLTVVSVGALAYAGLSLFQPIKSRYIDQVRDREEIKRLLENYPASSEDFFKLWPKDKAYFLDDSEKAGLALAVRHGMALVVGDPIGDSRYFDNLVDEFEKLCYGNDWRAAFIHTQPQFSDLYKRHGYCVQKIGEEAVVDIDHFRSAVATNKDFRHIESKFAKLGYSVEVLLPPHHEAVIDRLTTISNEWLGRPGRTERGLMMGYFSPEYLSQCRLMVARDSAGTIQGFLNEVPSYDHDEANFDMLRHSNGAPGNINDYILTNFIAYIGQQGFKRFNMGLSPLAGLDEKDENYTIIDSVLRFAYSNGDRLYSFSGLHRFKQKYEPDWSPRYIVYKGGIRSFTRTINALNSAMKVRRR